MQATGPFVADKLFFFGSLGYLVGSYFGGRIYDRVPGHRFMAGVLVFLGILIALVPMATSLWVLLVVVLIQGLANGALDVGCNCRTGHLCYWRYLLGLLVFCNCRIPHCSLGLEFTQPGAARSPYST